MGYRLRNCFECWIKQLRTKTQETYSANPCTKTFKKNSVSFKPYLNLIQHHDDNLGYLILIELHGTKMILDT